MRLVPPEDVNQEGTDRMPESIQLQEANSQTLSKPENALHAKP